MSEITKIGKGFSLKKALVEAEINEAKSLGEAGVDTLVEAENAARATFNSSLQENREAYLAVNNQDFSDAIAEVRGAVDSAIGDEASSDSVVDTIHELEQRIIANKAAWDAKHTEVKAALLAKRNDISDTFGDGDMADHTAVSQEIILLV